MDITALSSGLSQANLMSQVSASVLKLSMDTVEQSMDNMIKMMETSVNPNLGGTIDISI
ncbi:Putative motility protein [Anaerosporobacter mobilis DSM 15930]|uniref:Putative motility protein n=1 Tax=Anaerosporobacter mobilis DSM 15930 TaxID=1120996 RepID=A0A1M7M3G0_9FIRM|nr:YjfB family protein [Anaerosporobacter mobilis]MBS5934817.1 YjfB family protein [Clostridiales bacterium]SHM85213.1 Putative motility protein [Anaerosporobacter mobilis DSM 15930]